MSPELERLLLESKSKNRLYHATGKDFSVFDENKIKRPYFGHGFHLTESPTLANFYAEQHKENQNVMPVYAHIKNPFVMKSMTDWYDLPGNTDKERTDWIKSQGYDGIKYPHGAPYNAPHESDISYVAFHPNQIKSAIGNRGTYDLNDPDITKAKGGLVHMGDGGSMYESVFSGEGSYAQGGSMSLSQEQLEQLRQLRQKIKGYGELENQYDKETSKIPLKDLESFETWKAKRGVQNKAKGGIISMLRKHGRPVDSDSDAMRKMSNGHRVFIAHEQDEIPREIHRVADMHGYTPDQIYTVAPEHFIQHKADGGSMAGVNLYSPLNKSAESIPRTKGTGAEFMTELSKKPGFKKAEVEDRGLEDLHGLPKMTKEEFHAHLNSKPIPKINTKIIKDEFGALDTVLYDPDDFRRDRHWVVDRHGEPVTDEPFPTLGHAQEYILDHPELDTKTFHKHYKLPGGDNYQEHLYKYQPEGQKSFVANHGHFGAEPNVLASARTVDRKTPEGKKILHVEEIQSDWHQRGRDEGYKQNLSELPKNYKLEERYIDNKREYLVKDENGKVFAMGLFPESALHNALDNLNNGSRVPNAPFKKNWEEMVAKQLLKHAVDNGYHGIALTPGKEQADRYSLAKHIDSLSYEKKGDRYNLRYVPKGGSTFEPFRQAVAPEELANHVGKEMAEKIINKEGNRAGSTGIYTFPNIDLQVGGEGMKAAYDKRIPNIFNDIGKKHGAKMQLHAMPVQKEAKHYAQMHDNGFGVFKENEDAQLVSSHSNLEEANAKAKELNSTKLHYMDLTPEFIEHIKKEGLPIYKKGGNVHVTGDLDTMKYELHMANGGSTLGQNMQPSLSRMKFEMSQRFNPLDIQNVGANEAPNMFPKAYVNPTNKNTDGFVPPGGVATPNGMPIGGVDQNPQQPGQQLTPQQPGQPPQPPQPAQPQGQSGQGVPPTQAPQQQPPMGNMLSLTPEGQAMNAMGGGTPQQPQHLADGGMARGGSKIKPPINYPVAKPISDKEMMAHAERIVRQMQGLDNPNQRTLQQIAREAVLPVDVRHYGSEIERPSVNYESLKGGQLIGIPGDPSIGGLLPRSEDPFENQQASVKLHGIGDRQFENAIPIYGGYKYGAYGNPQGAWAGNISAARGIQNQVKNLSKANKSADVYGQYVKMTPQSLDYALHTLDALMEHQQSHKLPNREEIVDLMRNKTTAGHKLIPTFPDMKDIEEVLLHGQLDAKMRKKLIHLLSTNKYVPTGKENFNDVIHAISHPELRNIETGSGGSAILKMNPKGSLEISSHPTYSHDIPSELIGQSKYIVPHQVAFPRTHAYAKDVIKKMGKKIVPFNQMKMMGMREPIDEQYINQIGKYEQEMKKRLGYKKGGKIKLHKDMDTMRLELTQRKKAK